MIAEANIENEYRFQTDDMAWTEQYEPDEPRHKPYRRVDLNKVAPTGPSE